MPRKPLARQKLQEENLVGDHRWDIHIARSDMKKPLSFCWLIIKRRFEGRYSYLWGLLDDAINRRFLAGQSCTDYLAIDWIPLLHAFGENFALI